MRKPRSAALIAAGVIAAVIAASAVPAFAQAGTTPSTTSLTADNNPAVTGQEVTFTATVSATPPGTGTPTGTVEFQSNGTDLPGCSAVTLDDTGSAQCQVASGLPEGSYSISAIYSGDDTFAGSTGTLTETVNQASTSTGLTADNNPAVTGQEVTFTATVSPVPPGTTAAVAPTGTVEFQSNGTDLTGCSAVTLLSSGSAQCQVASGFTSNTYSISAIYSGDNNFTGSTGDLSETVKQASTTTVLTSSPRPPVAGQSATFTATISVTSPGTTAAAAPSGTVEFESNGTAISDCSSQAVSGGVAQCSPASGVGGGSVSAIYSGDSNFIGSNSNTVSVNKASDEVTLASSQNPSVAGQPVTFIAQVSVLTSPESYTPTGTVTFNFYGTGTQPTCAGGDTHALPASGIVTCTIALSPANGVNNVIGVQALYSGDANFNAESEPTLDQTVKPDSTTTGLVASPQSPTSGSTENLVATVYPASPGGGTPTGFVTFKIKGTGGVLLTCAGGSNTIALTGGAAVCSLPGISSANSPYKATAKYGGSPSYGASSSAKVTIRVS
jgi:large repetitive protein